MNCVHPVAVEYWLHRDPLFSEVHVFSLKRRGQPGHTSGSFQTCLHSNTNTPHSSAQTTITQAITDSPGMDKLVLEKREELQKVAQTWAASDKSKCITVIYALSCRLLLILREGANLREMGTDDGARQRMAPVSGCADMWDWGAPPPAPVSTLLHRDIWQVAFKSLPLGIAASLTGAAEGPRLACFQENTVQQHSLPSPSYHHPLPLLPNTLQPSLSLEHRAKSALCNYPPLTHQMHARQLLFQTELNHMPDPLPLYDPPKTQVQSRIPTSDQTASR